MAHDVFISYSSDDKSIADAVCSYLETNSIRCWIAPRDISPGKKYAQDIMDAINDCKIMVVIFSAGANKSEHVSAEIERAMSKGIIIIPFRIEDIMPTGEMEYYLSGRHWLDALTVPMEEHIKKLVISVWALLRKQQPVSGINTPKLPKIKRTPVVKKNRVRTLSFILAAVLVLLVAGALLYKTLFNPFDSVSTANSDNTEAVSKPEATVSDDTAVLSGQTEPEISTMAANSAEQAPDAPKLPSDTKAQALEGSDGKTPAKETVPAATLAVKTEITDSILVDGWSKFQIENKGGAGDVNVIAKGFDANGKTVSLEFVKLEKVPEGKMVDGTVYLSNNPVKQELRIVKDYGRGIAIKEQVLLDGWVHVILVNGGETGDFDLVAKGYDDGGNIVSMEPFRMEKIQGNTIQKGSVYLSGNPVKVEVYIMKDYGRGLKVQEQVLLGGWAHILLANGGEQGNFLVKVKGYNDKGAAIAMETIKFDNMPKNRIVKGSVYLSGNPDRMDVSIK